LLLVETILVQFLERLTGSAITTLVNIDIK